MALTSNSRQIDGVTILDLSGTIASDAGSQLLRSAVKELAAQGKRDIVLNLGQVTEVDVTGVGELVCAHTSMLSAGGHLKLCNLPRPVHDLLQVTKLCTVFDIEYDEASAVDAFQRRP